jgi:hypothetical protein
MGALAYRQQQQTQQQIVHPEPARQSTPARASTEAPGFDEQLASAGNGERAAMLGLGGGEGAPLALGPGAGMNAARASASTAAAATPSEEHGLAFDAAEAGVMGLAEACLERLARFEDASDRWYHFGWGRDQAEEERPLYERDLRLHQGLALQLRQDGLVVEATRRLVGEALLESDATRLLLQVRGLAGRDQDGGLVLDPEDFEASLATAERALGSTGFRPGAESLSGELLGTPGALLAALEAQGHGLGASIAQLRAQAVSRRAGAVAEQQEGLERVIATCDLMGELMGRMAAGRLPVDGFDAPGLVARAVHEDELHALAAQLSALTRAEEAWGEHALTERVRDDVGEFCLASRALREHEASARQRRDDLTARLGNLGRTMDLHPGVQGAGPAMESLARVRATHLSLEAVVAPLDAAMVRVHLASSRFLAEASGATGQAWLDQLRDQLEGIGHFYFSVYRDLEASHAELTGRRAELAEVSDRFAAILDGHRA